MNTEATLQALLGEIERERELFGRFAEREACLTRVVQERDWTSLEAALATLEGLAADIEEVERRRHLQFQELKRELGVADRAGFELVLSRLPREPREALLRHQRDLKGAVARVRSLTGSLAYYFRYVKEAVEQVLGELLPHRRGRLYSRQGVVAEVGDGPVVLNRSL